jgi:hypothetical protein
MSAKPGEYPLTVRITLDDEWVEDLIEMAGYGISYWVGKAVVDSERRTYTVHPFDPDSGTLETPKRLTYGGIVRAAQKILTGQTCISPESVSGMAVWAAVMDNGDIDSEVADMVIQVAVHKEVLYS